MKKFILGLSLLALATTVSLAHGKDKGSCCKDKEKTAKCESKSKGKCCSDTEKTAKADKKAVKKVTKA
jgi:hypothetical protein